MKITTDNQKLNRMVKASLESIAWRQDRYTTGGIVESDERVDGGRKTYWPYCWPREFVVKPLLDFGETERVRKFLEFWKKCQCKDGSWLHCYDIRNYVPYDNTKETDNVGYSLQHIFHYYDYTKDVAWLKKHWPMLRKGADYLLSLYNKKYNLIWGVEEIVTPECDWPRGYSTHINCICARGLECASQLARVLGNGERSRQWLSHAKRIKKAIDSRLWEPREKRYLAGIGEDGKPRRETLFWFNLMPTFIKKEWSKKDSDNFRHLKRKLYNLDPKIPHAYWIADYRPVLKAANAEDAPCFRYTGMGAWIGGSPVAGDILLRGGFLTEAAQQLDVITKYTSDENNLMPEHINTISRGKHGNYNLYPKPYYYVDSGSLLHLSFFLTMLTTIVGRDDINKNVLWPKIPGNITFLRVDDLRMKGGYLSYQYEIGRKGCKMTIIPSKTMELTLYLQSHNTNKLFLNGEKTSRFQVVEAYCKDTKYLKLNTKVGDKVVIEVGKPSLKETT